MASKGIMFIKTVIKQFRQLFTQIAVRDLTTQSQKLYLSSLSRGSTVQRKVHDASTASCPSMLCL